MILNPHVALEGREMQADRLQVLFLEDSVVAITVVAAFILLN
jgi:hypothetical protein